MYLHAAFGAHMQTYDMWGYIHTCIICPDFGTCTCRMPAHVLQKAHVETARLYRITITEDRLLYSVPPWTWTAPAASSYVWTYSAGMYACIPTCRISKSLQDGNKNNKHRLIAKLLASF